jgi:acyl-coenzyme A thioesterase 9
MPLPAALAALCQPGARLVATGDTRYSATMVMQSQNRNLHGKIFGGFLMRQAMEIAWCNAHLFAGAFPQLELVDDIIFHKPVEIGSIVHFRSLTAFSHPPSQTGTVNRAQLKLVC